MNTQPIVVTDPAEALLALRSDGAVRLRTPGAGDASHAMQVARAVFGTSLRALPDPARVFEGGEQDRHQLNKGHQDPLPVHTDGFSYGDLYPDYILLCCVHASATGGDSFLVDGYQVLATIGADPETQWAADALASVAVNQTEEGMQHSVSPIVQHTDAGRLMVRRTLDELGNGPTPSQQSQDPARDSQMIEQWVQAIERAAESAPRFHLETGETLLVDNYRMFHGREGYVDPSRMMWRVWAWTDAARGVPDLPLHSDSRYARSSESG